MKPKSKPSPARVKVFADPASHAALETLKSLQLELRRLRSLAKEITAAYLTKLEARAQELSDRLGEASAIDAGVVGVMLKKVRNLDVKPNKGRRKDLRKIEELLDAIGIDIDALVDGSEKPAAADAHPKKRRSRRA